jgi:N-acetylmuramoyl-L-alanine amidase
MGRLRVVTRVFLALIFCLFLQSTLSQQALVINGQPLEGLSTNLIEGISYVPAASLANALGADFGYDPQSQVVTFDYASLFLSLKVYGTTAEVAVEAQTLSVDGKPFAGTAAIMVSGTIYVPVKPIIAALGGSLYFSEELQKVIVTFPRAVLRSAYVQPANDYDRLVFDFSGRTAYQTFLSPTLNTVQVRFTNVEAVSPQAFAGSRFTQAILTMSDGFADLVIQLQPGIMVESYTTDTPDGFSLIIDLFSRPLQVTTTVIVDPGHGGEDQGIVSSNANEADLVFSVAQTLEGLLNQQGIISQLTRENNITLSIDQRAHQGIGASLFLSLHMAEVLPGQINIYYLAEAPDQNYLDIAIQRNAQQALSAEATDSLRRRLLLRYLPDVARGEAYARAISDTLRQNPGYSVNQIAGLPLKVLEGAAGRGVLIELSAQDLANPQLAQYLVSAVLSALSLP